jgi:hypothetical protein
MSTATTERPGTTATPAVVRRPTRRTPHVRRGLLYAFLIGLLLVFIARWCGR